MSKNEQELEKTTKEDKSEKSKINLTKEKASVHLSVSHKTVRNINIMKEFYIDGDKSTEMTEKERKSKIVEEAIEFYFKNKFVEDLGK